MLETNSVAFLALCRDFHGSECSILSPGEFLLVLVHAINRGVKSLSFSQLFLNMSFCNLIKKKLCLVNQIDKYAEFYQ